MKKLFLITILVSLAWGQTCPYDGSGIRYRTGETKSSRDGYISYEWICEGNTVGSNRHKIWSEEKIQSPTGADNSYQQQPQQQRQQSNEQAVKDAFAPLTEPYIDNRTQEEKRRDEEKRKQEMEALAGVWDEILDKFPIVGWSCIFLIIYGLSIL